MKKNFFSGLWKTKSPNLKPGSPAIGPAISTTLPTSEIPTTANYRIREYPQGTFTVQIATVSNPKTWYDDTNWSSNYFKTFTWSTLDMAKQRLSDLKSMNKRYKVDRIVYEDSDV